MRRATLLFVLVWAVGCADSVPSEVEIGVGGPSSTERSRGRGAAPSEPLFGPASPALDLPTDDELSSLEFDALLPLLDDSRAAYAAMGRARLLELLETDRDPDPTWLPLLLERLPELIDDAEPGAVVRWVRVIERFGPRAVTAVSRRLVSDEILSIERDLFASVLAAMAAGPHAGAVFAEVTPLLAERATRGRAVDVFAGGGVAGIRALAAAIRQGALPEDSLGFEGQVLGDAARPLIRPLLDRGHVKAATAILCGLETPAPEYAPVLEDLLARDDLEVTRGVAYALRGVGGRGLALARRLLAHEDEEVRAHTLFSVSNWGEDARPLWPEVLARVENGGAVREVFYATEIAKQLDEHATLVRVFARRVETGTATPTDIDCLARLGDAARHEIERAVPKLLGSPDGKLRRVAIDLVEQHLDANGRGRGTLLGPLLLDADPEIRLAARFAMIGQDEDTSWEPHVQAAIRDITATGSVPDDRLDEFGELLADASWMDVSIDVPAEAFRAVLRREEPGKFEHVLAAALIAGAVSCDELLQLIVDRPAWREVVLEVFRSEAHHAVDEAVASRFHSWLRPAPDRPDLGFTPAQRASLFESLIEGRRRQADALALEFLDDENQEIRAAAIDELPPYHVHDAARWTSIVDRLTQLLATGTASDVDAVCEVLPRFEKAGERAFPVLLRLAPALPAAARCLGAFGRPGLEAVTKAVAERPLAERHRVLDRFLEGLRDDSKYRDPGPDLRALCRDWLDARFGPEREVVEPTVNDGSPRSEALSWAIEVAEETE